MAKTTNIDKQGRILIPKDYREKLGLGDETPVRIHLVDRRIILEVYDSHLHLAVEKWKEKLIRKKIQAFTMPEPPMSSDPKWFSEEFARQKLGL
ncbi:MAG: hypothetical protein ACXADX_11535 [Candidatus Hodarchaeales archaeon]|jgi:AbrB family looped-hinge helix DNA binding protein